ncbi:uncharacterized protein LOC116201557 isoform X2 [Punica granatum]|uniref:Uncharacterized protein LOC116201557 isoform X2 n=1 Tax=Punica granatum TaxID=22663 RepID=A0A6P8CV88_PUNGR|nr:uncharacterized protein LOC116201557 isoform X2 [Punica granatum]
MMCPSDNISGPSEVQAIVLKLSESDPLYGKKKKILEGSSASVELRVPLQSSPSSEWINTTVKAMLQISRIIHLDEADLYFFEDSTEGCYSPKNEMEALNSMISLIDSSLTNSNCLHGHVLRGLRDAIVNLLSEFGYRNGMDDTTMKSHKCDEESYLLQWGERIGVQSRLQIAHIEGFGRGATAKEDLKVGDIALEIPVHAIICEETMLESDLHPVLQKIDGISVETMLLLWSMKERYNPSSKFKMYFETLPKEFNTGLSFGVNAIMALDGTPLFEELMQAKEHLRTQYEELFPALCNAHLDKFPPDLYTWDHYLWACELWYSNSMKVQFADGKLRTCLIPIAGFLNHSLYPHITRYGKIDPVTNTLKFPMSRPCRAGEQCYLSYGNFSNSHLITFYGFLPQGDNPYDVISLDIDCGSDGGDDGAECCNQTTHMVRGTWFSNDHNVFHYGLPSPLLDYLRKAQDSSSDINSPLQDKLKIEVQVLEDLYATFSGMMENLGDSDSDAGDNVDWDVNLVLKYKDLQRRIISSILSSCSSGLKMLEDELCRFASGDLTSKSETATSFLLETV